MTGKARPRTLFLISGIWFSAALLLMWRSRGSIMALEHQAWGVATAVVFLLRTGDWLVGPYGMGTHQTHLTFAYERQTISISSKIR